MFFHRFDIPVKGIKKKTIFHFSDSHLTVFDKLSSEEERVRAEKGTQGWITTREDFGRVYKEPISMMASDEMFAEMIREANRYDAAVITGDTLEFVGGANLRLLERGLAQLNVPHTIVCGNHEPVEEIPDNTAVSYIKEPVRVVEMDDMLLVSVNNGGRILTKEQLNTLKAIFARKIPVVLSMHIPIMTEDNYAVLSKCGEYFQFNFDGCPQENLELIDMLTAEDSPVVAVLTGHLHFGCISKISEKLTQYGASQAVGGHCNVYTIGE